MTGNNLIYSFVCFISNDIGDSSKSPVIKQALKLLNTHGGEFDAAKVQERERERGSEWNNYYVLF